MEPLDLRFLEETFPFWKGLTLREQQKLLSQTRCYVYPKGSRIHSGLEGCTGVLAVKRGQLRAYLMSDERNHFISLARWRCLFPLCIVHPEKYFL